MNRSFFFLSLSTFTINAISSGVTGGGRVPLETFDREISADLTGKREAREKKENGEKEGKLRRVENWKWKEEKLQNEERTFFFYFSLFKTTEICFGSTKIEIFFRETAFYAGKKIRKNDCAPSDIFPVTPLAISPVTAPPVTFVWGTFPLFDDD